MQVHLKIVTDQTNIVSLYVPSLKVEPPEIFLQTIEDTAWVNVYE